MICSICLDEINLNVGILQPCTHSFCFECVLSWINQDKQFCPLCNLKCSQLQQVIHDNIIYHEILDKQSKDQQNNETFECLDHHYFLAEIKKLLQRIKYVKPKSASQINLVYQMKEILLGKEYLMINFENFEPTEFAISLFEIDDQIKLIELNQWNKIDMTQFEDKQFTYNYNNDDEFHVKQDEEQYQIPIKIIKKKKKR